MVAYRGVGGIGRIPAAARLAWSAAPAATILSGLTALAAAGVPVAVAWLTRSALDEIAAGRGRSGPLIWVATALAAVGVLTAVVPRVERYLAGQLARTVGVSGIRALHQAVDRFVGLRRLEDPSFLNQLRLATLGVRAAGELVSTGLGVTRAGLTLVGFTVSLCLLSPVMTALVLGGALPTMVAELALARRRTNLAWNIGPAERRELFYGDLLIRPGAAKEIRLFGLGAMLRGRMLAERRQADAARRRLDRRELMVQGGLALLSALVSGTGLVWAIRAAREGGLSLGDVSVFVAAVAGTQGALAALITQLAVGRERLTLFGHFRSVLEVGPDLPVPALPQPVPALRHSIEFDDVWFRYGDEHPWILRGVSLTIRSGQSLALVGRNGAGKSTVVKLLCRLYDPTRGSIRWDGTDLRALDPVQLRQRITAVFQDFVEYDLTAGENIGLGDVAAMDDAALVRGAAQRAGVHGAITALPRGYDTLLSRIFSPAPDEVTGAAGVVLSGGQWQRVALARALMRSVPDLLILDEPSSGLDAEAEYEIHAMLREYRVGRTSLLISHRLSAVRDADRIVVLHGGVPVEDGTHSELICAGGEYAALFRRQAAGYADDPPTAPVDVAPVGIGAPR